MSSATRSPSERDTRLYVEDMLGFCDRVLTYAQSQSQATLVADPMRYDATLRNLELMGEAATHVPEAVRQMDGEIPWRQIIATRNRLIHAYLGIDPDTVWSIVNGDVPTLRKRLAQLLTRI